MLHQSWLRQISIAWFARTPRYPVARSKRFSRLLLLIVAALVLAIQLPKPTAGHAQSANDESGTYTGWALDAYPSMSSQDFVSTLTRMRDAGANLVWLGQNNPEDVDPNANEVGLSFANYLAATNSSDPRNADGLAIMAAQRRALDAARAVGLKVVLPVNYRTQMGAAWSAAHQDSLRRGPDGTILNFDGYDASPYAGDFRSDTTRYYQWVDQSFIQPYRDVILMVNLSDEPSGVDYSSPADAAFAAEVGYHFADVGTDPQRVTQLGAFQSEVMVDFATWAAQQWLSIDPAMTVTLSFDGGPGRKNQQAPEIEDIFRRAPPNFEPGWDAYPRDGLPTEVLDDSDITALSSLLGTLGHFSAKYHRPYWLWSAGNSWGLAGGSSTPSTIADAQVNLRMLADISREAGGLLRGIAVWNYNLRGQGLYNDSYHPSYQPDDMFTRLSAMLPATRQILAGPDGPGPDVLVLAPNALPDRLIGGTRLVDIWGFRGYNFEDLISLARTGSTTAVVETLAGEDLSGIRMLVVLARDAGDLSSADVAAIRAYRAGGGVVVDAQTVDAPLQLSAQWSYPGDSPELYFAVDYTKTQVGPVASLGLPRLTNSFAIRGPSELIAYGGAPQNVTDPLQAWLNLPVTASAAAYAPSGVSGSSSQIGPGKVAIPTAPHAYSLIPVARVLADIDPPTHAFPETGFQITDDAIWNYFSHRGGVNTFGYPVSRSFRFQGFVVQFFQRRIVQLDANGSPRLLNVLDPGLLPYTSFNGATLPAFDGALVGTVPPASDSGGILAFVRANTPDTYHGAPVEFGRQYWNTVSPASALADGGDPALVPGFDLEMWGLPTSRPAVDPNNHNVVYLRFQRGVMMYDAGCGCTEGILLADYLKSILTGANLPADLTQEAQGSPLYHQYDPSQPKWVRNPTVLPNTDLTNAFTPG